MKSGLCFKDFKNRHENESIVVCGLGESLNLLDAQIRFCPLGGRIVTIGVNDIGRKFHPWYLLNVNNRNQYKGDRFTYIENTQAKAIFSHLPPHEQGNAKAPIVKFEIARHAGGVEIVDDKLPHFRNSPYVAVSLAAYMGARRIGLIGVDFTDNHFWIKDGPHRLNSEFGAIDVQYGKLWAHLHGQGIELVNLSPISRLTSIPKVSLNEFQAPLEHCFN